MDKKLINLITEYRRGDDTQFSLIIEKFKPVIDKYSLRLYKDEREDTASELVLALLEAVQKIKYYYNEGQCVTFLTKALEHRFFELYRKSRKKFDHEQPFELDFDFCDNFSAYGDAEVMEDLKRLLSDYSAKKQNIIAALFIEGKRNSEVAAEYKISRQYVHRLKNKVRHELKHKYLN